MTGYNFNNRLNQLYTQKEHIILNNKYDDNYEDQINYIENQIKTLEEEKYYSELIDNNFKNKKFYIYKGPIYDAYDNYLGKSKEYTTYAKSDKEAIRNISYRIKKDLNKDKCCPIYLDNTYLKIKE